MNVDGDTPKTSYSDLLRFAFTAIVLFLLLHPSVLWCFHLERLKRNPYLILQVGMKQLGGGVSGRKDLKRKVFAVVVRERDIPCILSPKFCSLISYHHSYEDFKSIVGTQTLLSYHPN